MSMMPCIPYLSYLSYLSYIPYIWNVITTPTIHTIASIHAIHTIPTLHRKYSIPIIVTIHTIQTIHTVISNIPYPTDLHTIPTIHTIPTTHAIHTIPTIHTKHTILSKHAIPDRPYTPYIPNIPYHTPTTPQGGRGTVPHPHHATGGEGDSAGSAPPFPSICKLLAAFLRSSFVFARSLQHFWLPASHLLGACYLLGDLRSTHTPSKYLRATYSHIYMCCVSTVSTSYLLPVYSDNTTCV